MASLKAISPIVTDVTVAWSVHLSVCRLSHSCTPLKTLDGRRCRDTRVVQSNIVLYRGSGLPMGRGDLDFGVGTPSSQRRRLSPNYFGPFFSYVIQSVDTSDRVMFSNYYV